MHETYTVASLTDLGPAEVDGVATTKYEVGYAPASRFAPHQAPQTLTQHPSSVWIDSAGRLVQVRSTLYFSGRLPHGGKLPAAFAGFPGTRDHGRHAHVLGVRQAGARRRTTPQCDPPTRRHFHWLRCCEE